MTVLFLVIGAAFYFNPHHQSDLTATRTEIFAPQTAFAQMKSKGSMNIVGAAPEVEHDVYAIITIHVHDELRLPLFIDEVDGKYIGANGAEIDEVSPGSIDLARVQEVFPQLKALLPHPVLIGDTVPPKGSLDGQVLLHFGNITEEDWRSRKPSTLTVKFTHQDPISVTIP